MYGPSAEPLHMPGDREPRGARRRRGAGLVHRALQPHTDRADHTDAMSRQVPRGMYYCSLFIVKLH